MIHAGVIRQRGIALMLVMWVLTLLTIMAVSLTAAQRTETALAENQVEAARFRALAEAAIAYAALDFMTTTTKVESTGLDEESSTTWLPDGSARSWEFDGSELTIAVFNETSRFNLNKVQQDMLARLLEVLGVDEDQSTSLAAAIVDWRDEDNLALLNGAEDEDYEKAGRAIGAKDADYASVEELRQVLGMTEDIYKRLAPEVSVDGDEASPVELFASSSVLAAIKNITLDEAAEEVATRAQTTTQERGGPLYRIQVTERTSGHSSRRMEALFQLASGEQPPYQVLWRRYGLGTADPVAVTSEGQ